MWHYVKRYRLSYFDDCNIVVYSLGYSIIDMFPVWGVGNYKYNYFFTF